MRRFRVRLGRLSGPTEVLDAVDAMTVGCASYLIATEASDWTAAQPWADFVITTEDQSASTASIRAKLVTATYRVTVIDVASTPGEDVLIPPNVCDPVIGPLVGAAELFSAVTTVTEAGFPIADAGRGRNRGRDYVRARFKLHFADARGGFAGVVSRLRQCGLPAG